MKKVLSFILILFICSSVVCCNKEDSAKKSVEERNAEVRAILTAVLNKEKSFILHNDAINVTSEQILERFWYPTISNVTNYYGAEYYMFVDFDADGIDELLVLDWSLTDYLFLHCEGDDVYGYMHRGIALSGVKPDGRFRIDRLYHDGYEIICNISFDKETAVVENKAYRDEEEGIYLLDGENASKEEVEKYFEDWDKNTSSIHWENLD